MLWIQHSRWCRCSVGSKRWMRAESECACLEQPSEVWNLDFNCPVVSREVWGPWPGRAGLLGPSPAAGTIRDWHGVLCHGQSGKCSGRDRYNWQCYSSATLKPAPPQYLLTDGEENTEKPLQWSLQGLQATPYSSPSASTALPSVYAVNVQGVHCVHECSIYFYFL